MVSCKTAILAAVLATAAAPFGAEAKPMRAPWMRRVNERALLGQKEVHPRVRSRRTLPPGVPSYTTRWFNQTVDHFNYQTPRRQWPQRMLLNGDYYTAGGPLLFYTGNEGDITDFWANTGFIFVLAQKLGAYVAFGEHRYFGQSWPFGDPKTSFLKENVGYLTVEQALRDYAVMIPEIKSIAGMPQDTPTVAVGGSYGGMLSFWFRMKYPSVVVGALAASAPILQYQGLVDPEVFNRIATDDFSGVAPSCASDLRTAIQQVSQKSGTAAGRAELTGALNLCSAMQESQTGTLMDVIYNGLTYMAMTDYPEASDFLQPMPAWPVTAACKAAGAATQAGAVGQLAAALSVYYNHTGQTPCYNLTGGGTSSSGWLGDSGWDYLACTSQVMPMSSDGVRDMFLPAQWDLDGYMRGCEAGPWAVTPNPYWAQQAFGPGISGVEAVSNVIASQGALDPWSGGGVNASTASYNSGVTAILIEDGAHHLDLRMPNPDDPASVVKAREIELETIRGWIDEVNAKRASRTAN